MNEHSSIYDEGDHGPFYRMAGLYFPVLSMGNHWSRFTGDYQVSPLDFSLVIGRF